VAIYKQKRVVCKRCG